MEEPHQLGKRWLCMMVKSIVPMVLYGRESWALNIKERKRVGMLVMKCFRTICDKLG